MYSHAAGERSTFLWQLLLKLSSGKLELQPQKSELAFSTVLHFFILQKIHSTDIMLAGRSNSYNKMLILIAHH